MAPAGADLFSALVPLLDLVATSRGKWRKALLYNPDACGLAGRYKDSYLSGEWPLHFPDTSQHFASDSQPTRHHVPRTRTPRMAGIARKAASLHTRLSLDSRRDNPQSSGFGESSFTREQQPSPSGRHSLSERPVYRVGSFSDFSMSISEEGAFALACASRFGVLPPDPQCASPDLGLPETASGTDTPHLTRPLSLQ